MKFPFWPAPYVPPRLEPPRPEPNIIQRSAAALGNLVTHLQSRQADLEIRIALAEEELRQVKLVLSQVEPGLAVIAKEADNAEL